MFRLIVAGACALALAGCAETKYAKPGATPQEFDVAKAQCRMQMSGAPQVASYQPQVDYNSTTTLAGNMGYTTTQPNGYQALGAGLNSASDNLMNIAMRQRFFEDCMLVNGFRKIE